MGLLDSIFGGDKPTQKNIDKLVMRLKERYAQPEYRRGRHGAAPRLGHARGADRRAAALHHRRAIAALGRGGEALARRRDGPTGRSGRQALRTFLAKENHIAFAARALQRLDNQDEYIVDLQAALKARPPEDYRSTHGKAELIACLTDTGDARVIPSLLPYLDDHGDDVRCAVVDALERLWEKLGDQRPVVQQRLAEVITDDSRSARVLRHTSAAMQRLQVPIDPTRPLAPAVAEDPRHQGRQAGARHRGVTARTARSRDRFSSRPRSWDKLAP